MALYTRILVPLDGSAIDDVVLDHVVEMARRYDAEVVLLRVAHYHTRDERVHEMEEAQACVAGADERLRDSGLKVRTVVGQGEPAAAILAQARELEVDLIAMATHGHGTLQRLFAGSVADKVRHASDVPLLLIKGRQAGDDTPATS
jgi:nucleotide-binding universal stress UspA family protein